MIPKNVLVKDDMLSTFDKLSKLLHREVPDRYPPMVPKLNCVDGLKLSMQASKFHYCTPRDNYGPWSAVEIGFPTLTIPELLEYAEDADNPTDTVYANVPLTLLAKIIDDHGGLK